jgi:hypothetical protein
MFRNPFISQNGTKKPVLNEPYWHRPFSTPCTNRLCIAMSHKETSMSDQTTPLSTDDEATPSSTNQIVTILSAPQTQLAMTSPQTPRQYGWYDIPVEILKLILEGIDITTFFRLMRTCKFSLQVMLRPSSWIAFISRHELLQLSTSTNGDKPLTLYEKKFAPSTVIVEFPCEIPLEMSWNRVHFMRFLVPHKEDPRDRCFSTYCLSHILSDGFFNIELLRALCLPKICSKEHAQCNPINPISKDAFWEIDRYNLTRPDGTGEDPDASNFKYLWPEDAYHVYAAATDAEKSRISLVRHQATLSVLSISLLRRFPHLKWLRSPQMAVDGLTKLCLGMFGIKLRYLDPPNLPTIAEPVNHAFFVNLKVLHLDIKLKLDFMIKLPPTLGELDVHGCRMQEGDYCPFVCLYADECFNLKRV